MCWSKFHGALWNDVAVIFNCINMIVESINFFAVDWNNFRSWVLLLSWIQWTSLSQFGSSCCFCSCQFFFAFFDWLSQNHKCISWEHLLSSHIVLSFVLVVQSFKWNELKCVNICFSVNFVGLVSGTAPVEFLFRELITIFIAYSHSNVIIIFKAIDPTPKE